MATENANVNKFNHTVEVVYNMPMLNEELALIQKQRARLFDILNRHVRAGDDIFNDRAFVVKVYRRWSDESNSHIGDPADGVILERENGK